MDDTTATIEPPASVGEAVAAADAAAATPAQVVDEYANRAASIAAAQQPAGPGPGETVGEGSAPEGEEAAPFSDDYLAGWRAAVGAAADDAEPTLEVQRLEQLEQRDALLVEISAQTGIPFEQLRETADAQVAAAIEARQQADLVEAHNNSEVARAAIAQEAERLGFEPMYVAVDETLAVARQTYAEIANVYGDDVAAQLAPEILRTSTASVSERVLAGAREAIEVQDAGRWLAGRVGDYSPVRATEAAAERFDFELWRHGGDEQAAVAAALDHAAREEAGGQPTPTGITRYHSERASQIHDAGKPEHGPRPETFDSPRAVGDWYAAEAQRLERKGVSYA